MTRKEQGLLIAGAAIVAGWALARRSVLPSTQLVGASALPPGVAPQHSDWLASAHAALAAGNAPSGVALAPSNVVLNSTPIGSGYVDLSGGTGGDWFAGDDPTMADDLSDVLL